MKNILFLILFLITSQVIATDYYFSSSTGSDGGAGTQASPYATMEKLASINLVAGDRIYFKRGDIWKPTSSEGRLGIIELTNVNGTEANPIIFDAYSNGNLPVISDELNTSYGSTIRFFSSASYIYFRNLHIYGEIQWKIDKETFGTTTGVHHVKFNECYFEYGRFSTSNLIVGHPTTYNYVPYINDPYTNPIYKIEIGNCTLENQGLYLGDDWVNFVYGIRYIDEDGNSLNGSGLLKDSPAYLNRGQLNLTTGAMPDTNLWIHDNIMINSYDELLDIPGGNLHLIERNYFIGSRDYANMIKLHGGYSILTDCVIRDNVMMGASWNVAIGDGSTGGGFALIHLMNSIVENNTSSARFAATLGNMNRTGNGNSGSAWGNFSGNIIRNNNFYGTVTIRGTGYSNLWGWETDMLDSITYVNTFEGNNYYINQQYPESMIIRAYKDDRVGAISSKHIGNNSSYRGTFQDVWVNEFPTTNESNVNPQMTNPVWVDPYNPGDYTLKSGSPLIDAGSMTGVDHIYDINLNQRTQVSIDVGAYEFNGTDITSPRVTSASLLNETTLLVNFSESLNGSTAQNTSNYSISNGVIVSNASLSGNQVTLTTSVHSSGNFTVSVNNVQDMAGNVINSNNIASYSFSPDNTAPELVSAQINSATTVEVLFSERVNELDAENVNNYSINNEISVSSASLVNSNKAVLATSTHLPGNYIITVINVRDIAGNTINSQSNSANYILNSVLDTIAISSYNFVQGSDPSLIYDIAPDGDPVNLIIENLNDVSWLEPNGIDINSPTKILSKLSSNKITQACKQSNEISIEVWLRPKTLTQNGPARIVSLSANPNMRNFTLGQGSSNGANDVFDVRLRTTESNSNGLPSVTSLSGYMSTTEMSHVVYTHNRLGESRIYVNSIEVASEVIGGDFSNWDDKFHLILGNEFTGDRPWLGEIFHLSIYGVALNSHFIDSLYSISVITEIEEKDLEESPSNFFLNQNYPNPFNPETNISFLLPTKSNIKFSVFNVLGELIGVLINNELTQGKHTIKFNGQNLSSGVYFYKLESSDFIEVRKMLLSK